MRSRSHGLRVGRRRSSRWRSPSRTRPCWSCRAARCRRPCSRAATVASYGGRQPSRIFEPLVVGHALGDDDVLERHRHAGQRAELGSRRAGGVDLGGLRRARPRVDVQVGAEHAVLGGDPVQVGPGHLDGAHLAGGEQAGELGGVGAW
jgi:hypothetical protein